MKSVLNRIAITILSTGLERGCPVAKHLHPGNRTVAGATTHQLVKEFIILCMRLVPYCKYLVAVYVARL
jgi:hypothetical protein